MDNSLMLFLPDDWEYNIKGLAFIRQEKDDSVNIENV
jgi:hypothetical protein